MLYGFESAFCGQSSPAPTDMIAGQIPPPPDGTSPCVEEHTSTNAHAALNTEGETGILAVREGCSCGALRPVVTVGSAHTINDPEIAPDCVPAPASSSSARPPAMLLAGQWMHTILLSHIASNRQTITHATAGGHGRRTATHRQARSLPASGFHQGIAGTTAHPCVYVHESQGTAQRRTSMCFG